MSADARAAGSDDSSDGGALGDIPCGLAADHEVLLELDGSGWSFESSATGGRTAWVATAAASASAGPIAPGESVSVSLRFEPPLRIERNSGTFDLRFTAINSNSEQRAVRQQEVQDEGTMGLGPGITGDWALDASGQAQALSLSAYGLNPNEGETLSCVSIRAVFNPVGYDVNDNSAIPTQPGGTVAWDGVAIQVSELSEVDIEPFAFSFER